MYSSKPLAGTLCRIDDVNPESNMKTPVERAEDWLYLCAIFSDKGEIDEELNSVVPPSQFFNLHLLVVSSAFTITCSTNRIKWTRKATSAFYRRQIAL